MSDLQRYIKKRKKADKAFAIDFDQGYVNFKLGAMLKEARIEKGLTQEILAQKINTKKTAISRLENHAEDIKLSTLEKIASALGKKVTIVIQ
jgi:HTH-type transcriptional regulator / antitoxin HipB